MRVEEIWRYPVKSMAGERLEVADIGPLGIAGDRIVHAEDGHGRILTARTKPGLLGLHARLGPDGEPLVDGRPWASPEVAAAVRQAAGEDARLVRDEGRGRFDVLPLLVATDGAIARLGIDRRRLRPNIVLGGVDGLAERTWPGGRLQLGDVIISVVKVRSRCVMTTFDPDTLEQDILVLHRIVTELGGRIALDCDVILGGRLAVGAAARLQSEEHAVLGADA